MAEQDFLVERFEASRAHLRSVAYRMLGSQSEADDAVQEAWLRFAGADTREVENLRGWLTTTVARICLDTLRTRRSRREESLGREAEAVPSGADAERDALLADSVGVAMLVVLDQLAPAERVAFVLHDMFGLSFEDVAPVVGRSPVAARQLASRARRRVRGAQPTFEADRVRQREVVGAFLAASRDGDFSALLAVLDPDVVLRADAAAVELSAARVAQGAPLLARETRGHESVANVFKGRAKAARLAFVEGEVGAVFAIHGKPFSVFEFFVEDGRIVEINVTVEAEHVRTLEI